MKALVISQSGIGRSDPQIIYTANSLFDFGMEVHLFQCIHKGAPNPSNQLLRDGVICESFFPIIPMWSLSAFLEFSDYIIKKTSNIDYDYIFAFDFSGILVINKFYELKSGFRSVIFMLENIAYFNDSHGCFGFDVLSSVWGRSVVVYPEVNRLQSDLNRFGDALGKPQHFHILPPTTPSTPTLEVTWHNNHDDQTTHPVNIIYAGSIVNQSFAIEFGYALIESGLDFKYDLYGPVGPDMPQLLDRLIESSNNKIIYKGIVDQEELNNLYGQYKYSFVGWKPFEDNYFYACPNKFFQSLRSGAIPIVVPHPLIINAIEAHSLSCIILDWKTDNWPNLLKNNTSNYDYQAVCNNFEMFNLNMSWDSQVINLFSRLGICE